MVLTASLKIFTFLPFSVAKGLEICIITHFIEYGMHSMFHNVRITVCKSIDLIAIHCCVQSIYLQHRNILINA